MNKFLNFSEYALYEISRNELISGALQDRVKKAENVKVVFDGAKFKNNICTLNFESIDKKSVAGKSWGQNIQLLELSKDAVDKKSIRKALSGNLKLHCDCPDFLYKGFQYIGTKKEYAINSESMPPEVRNPDEEGTVCKHLLGVLNQLDKFLNKIFGELA